MGVKVCELFCVVGEVVGLGEEIGDEFVDVVFVFVVYFDLISGSML